MEYAYFCLEIDNDETKQTIYIFFGIDGFSFCYLPCVSKQTYGVCSADGHCYFRWIFVCKA